MQWYKVEYAVQFKLGTVMHYEQHVQAESASLAKKLVRLSLLDKNVKVLMITARKERGK